MNHGSMPVAADTSSTVAPARRARSTKYSRPSVGIAACASSSATGRSSSCAVQKPVALVSIERSALPSASVKLRPIAIASPTLFMCVVSTGSAPGNFSNAKRGTLTTT